MAMFDKLNYKSLLYIDIETVMVEEKFSSLPEKMQELYLHKAEQAERAAGKPLSTLGKPLPESWQGLWEEYAALYPEFGKVCCISVGFYGGDDLKTLTVAGTDESKLLRALCELVRRPSMSKVSGWIAHNGKSFDFPYLIKRCLINRISPPRMLQTFGTEPWKLSLYDTKEIWKFGSYENISLDLLAAVFGLPSPKDEMKGKDVYKHFYAGNLDGIKKYCAKDVKTLASIVREWCNNEDVSADA